jgi:hypothetical protein
MKKGFQGGWLGISEVNCFVCFFKNHKCYFLLLLLYLLSRKLSKLRATSPKKPNYKGTHHQIDNFGHNVSGADMIKTKLGLQQTPELCPPT